MRRPYAWLLAFTLTAPAAALAADAPAGKPEPARAEPFKAEQQQSKGSVMVEGRLFTDKWETKEGEKRSRLIVKAHPSKIYCSGAMDVNHKTEKYNGETPDIIDNAFCIVDFENGARALLDLCMFAENSRHQVLVCYNNM